MAVKITFDIRELKRAISQSIPATAEGIRDGLNDVKNDWIAESKAIAPQKDGHLIESIDGEVNGLSAEVGVLSTDLRHASGKDFNYATYIHDYGGKAVTGEAQFLDAATKSNQAEWERMLDRSLEKSLRKAGWR